MKHLGDYDASTVIYGKFTTYRPSTGAAFALGGTPALSVYKDNSTTQSTTGVTLTADFDSVTGLNHFAIDTSADGTFYAAGSFFDIVITTGTVDSVSVVGTVVASFTIRKDSSLKPTTAGRTLDVSAGGEAGLDWANVGSPTTSVTLSGTTVGTITTYTGNTPQTGDAYARLGAPAGASVSADVAAIKSDTAAILADTGTDGVVVAAGSKTGYSLSAAQTFDLTGNITGNLSGSVGSLTTNNDKTGYALSATGSAALTEGYASLGATATLPQILYEIRALLAEKSISTTTLTTKKLDGSTTAATYTLDDATTPSAITRAT